MDQHVSRCPPFIYYWLLVPDYNSLCCFFKWWHGLLSSLVLREAREVWTLTFPGGAIRGSSMRLGCQVDLTVLLSAAFHQFLLVWRQLMVKTVSRKRSNISAFPTSFNELCLLGYLGPSLALVLFSTLLPAHHEHFWAMVLPVLSLVEPLPEGFPLQFSPDQVLSVLIWSDLSDLIQIPCLLGPLIFTPPCCRNVLTTCSQVCWRKNFWEYDHPDLLEGSHGKQQTSFWKTSFFGKKKKKGYFLFVEQRKKLTTKLFVKWRVGDFLS